MYWYPAAVLSVRKVSANSHVLSHLSLQNDLKRNRPFLKREAICPTSRQFWMTKVKKPRFPA